MIREDEIREFQEIIGGRQIDSDNESLHSIFDRNEELPEKEFDDTLEGKDFTTGNSNSIILLITGILGLIFVVSVFIGAVMYIYMKNDSESRILNKTKPSQTLKIPGIENLVTDPKSEDRIKVWCVRSAVPPSPRLGDYDSFFSESDNYTSSAYQ